MQDTISRIAQQWDNNFAINWVPNIYLKNRKWGALLSLSSVHRPNLVLFLTLSVKFTFTFYLRSSCNSSCLSVIRPADESKSISKGDHFKNNNNLIVLWRKKIQYQIIIKAHNIYYFSYQITYLMAQLSKDTEEKQALQALIHDKDEVSRAMVNVGVIVGQRQIREELTSVP